MNALSEMWFDNFNEFANFLSILNPSLTLLILDFSIQFGGFIIASLLHTEKFYDLFGSLSFISLTYLNFKWHNNGSPRQVIQTTCICIWALRLGLFLFTRILKCGKDRRFNKIKESTLLFFSAWMLQGVWVFVTLLPSLLCVQSRRFRPLGWRDFIGWSIWVIGFLTETVADYQKTSFRQIKDNKDKFISSGLWRFSRHPNYVGEILLWFGLYISASSVFKGYEYLTVFSPVFVYFLITRVSGIPPLEIYAIKKWGKLPSYQEYLKKTPALIPSFK